MKNNNTHHHSTNDFYNTDLFFELSMDLHCIAGYDGFFKKVNPAVVKTLGYTEEELYSKPINAFIHQEDVAITSRHRDNIHKNAPLLYFENRYITKNGGTVWLSWTSIPYESEKLVYAIAKNVTHLKCKEEDRNGLLSSLTKMNDNFKHLSYTISHDLRSPINNLLSIIDFIDTSKINDDETLQMINLIKSTSTNLKSTVELYISKLTNEQNQNYALEEVNLHNSYERVAKSIQTLILTSQTTIQTDFSAFENVLFNHSYLDSIFLNLITNSIKYAKAGVSPMISIRTKLVNGEKKLLFSDNGQGFELNKVKNKLFGLHQKFHNYSDSTGIGLYLVYTHIKNLGGTIDIESEVDKGTTFTIHFIN